ncbi:hypothetical protein PDIDSM_1063 [Penicillium digitatum]|nr:hypothetical protein PDIDSM_1063 [Penicillium digitatum]
MRGLRPRARSRRQMVVHSQYADPPCEQDSISRGPATLPGEPTTTLAPTSTAKYLGVWLDKYLDFSTHRRKIPAKGASSLEALRGISGSTWGSSLVAMRRVYQAVIIPQMLWGLSAWYCPAARSMPRGDLDKLTNELIKIQKRAAILISGAFRGTAGAALDTELYLLPIKLRLQQTVEETAIRILTGPQWACPQTAKETRKPTQRRLGGWAPTEAIAQKKPFRLLLGEKWEESKLLCWHRGRHQSHASLRTKKPHSKLTTHYTRIPSVTNRSSFNALYRRKWIRRTHWRINVYAAELSGIEMALAKAKKEQAREVIIFSNSQAAIQAVQNPRRPSGKYILTRIYDHIRVIRSRNQVQQEPTTVTIRWIPAHVGVSGNEYADTEAKGAALLGAGIGATTGSGDPGKPTIRLAAAAKRAVRQRVRERWERETTSAPTKRLVQAPNKKTLRLYEGLSKPQCAILIQMHRCLCDEGSQTPKHILMQCPRYTIPRTKRWKQLWDIGINEMDYDKIVSNPQATRYVVNFMHQTGLLQQFRHARIEDDDEPVGLTAMDLGVEDDGY